MGRLRHRTGNSVVRGVTYFCWVDKVTLGNPMGPQKGFTLPFVLILVSLASFGLLFSAASSQTGRLTSKNQVDRAMQVTADNIQALLNHPQSLSKTLSQNQILCSTPGCSQIQLDHRLLLLDGAGYPFRPGAGCRSNFCDLSVDLNWRPVCSQGSVCANFKKMEVSAIIRSHSEDKEKRFTMIVSVN